MQKKHAPETGQNDLALEQQLEGLFSDVFLPPDPPASGRVRAPEPPAGKIYSRLVEEPYPRSQLQGQPRQVPDRSRRLWLAGSVVIFVLIILVSFLTATIYGSPLESVASAASSQNNLDSLARALDPDPTQPAFALSLTPVFSLTPTLTATPRPTATPVPATFTATNVPPAFDTPAATVTRATVTPLPSTATPTPTPTPTRPSATPTLAQVQPVYAATATPVPAYVMGLSAVPTPVPRIALPDQAVNIVLLGSDQRPYETYWRTDVVIVVSVNPEIPSVSMLSIPRDLWLYIPNWTYNRINLADSHGAAVAYPGGGPGLVKATIEYNLGVHVDYYARVDFAGLMRIVDTLGGIEVLLECPVEDGFPDDPITEDPSVVTQISYPEPGLYHIDGKHALWLARSRKTTSEFARSRRQHRILQGIWNKAQALGYITRLPDLWVDLTETVETDLELQDVLWLASIGLQLQPSQIRSGFIDGRYVTAWVSPGGGNVLLPHTDAILASLEPLFNPYPYKAAQGLNQVEVWNASGHENWEWLATDKLVRNGFEVVAARQVDELSPQTVLVDYTVQTKGSPRPLLQTLFDASITDASIAGNTENTPGVSFRLILGQDYQPCERPAPAQWRPTPTPAAVNGD